MNQIVYLDHIYDLIELEKEFVNYLDIFKEEIELCKQDSQIGIISRIFPLAIHSKWEHQLGLYNIINLCLQKGFVKTSKLKNQSIKFAALIHNIGHTTHSYSSEEALQYLISKEPFSAQIRQRYERVKTYICEKEQCNGECLSKHYSKSDFFYINRWETALILLKNQELFDKVKSKDRNSGITLHDTIKYLICEQSEGNKLLRYFDRIDYVLRDIYYLGVLRFEVNLPYLFSQYKNSRPDEIKELQLIYKDLFNYVDQNIYKHKRVLIQTRIFQKYLLAKIYASNIDISSINSLRELDNTSDIKALLNDISEVNNYELVISDKIYNQSETETNLAVEQRLLPTDWDFLDYHEKKNALLIISGDDNDVRRYSIFAHKKIQKFSNILKIILSIYDSTEIDITKFNYIEKILSFIFDRKVEVSVKRFANLCESLFCEYINDNKELLLRIFAEIKHLVLPFRTTKNDLSNAILDLLSDMQFNSMKDEENTKIVKDTLVPIFLHETKAFTQYEECNKLLQFVISQLQKTIEETTDEHDISLELLIYLLEVLKIRSDDMKYVWVAPSIRIVTEDKHEIDCVVIEFYEDTIRLELIEATITDNEQKTLDDATKLQRIINSVKRRFDDIECNKRIIAPKQNLVIQQISELLKTITTSS